MTCIFCGGDTKVIESAGTSEFIIRKRQCKECKGVYYTKETDFDDAKEAARLMYEIRKENRNDRDNKN